MLVAQSCPVLCVPMDHNPPGSSVHEIFQAKMLECSHSLLQEIFPTQGSNLSLLHHRQILYHLSQQGFFEIDMCSRVEEQKRALIT